MKGREKIIAAIKENGRHTTNSLAELVGVSPKAIEKHLSKLKAGGILVRIGPDKGGHWEVPDSARQLSNTGNISELLGAEKRVRELGQVLEHIGCQYGSFDDWLTISHDPFYRR